MNNNELSISQKRAMKRAEFMRRFGQYWYVYAALAGTATLSFVSGLLMPFQPDVNGNIVITVGGVLAAFYYSVGFLTTGEGASYFWFDKLTDQDPDNGIQKAVAILMLSVSVATSFVTALAAGSFIAFYLGVFNEFFIMPGWAQKWVVFAIPTMWVLHFVAGTVFRYVSEESEYEREAKSIIREAQNQMVKSKARAKAEYWKQNAPDLANKLGKMEAQDELDAYSAKLEEKRIRREQNQPKPQVQTPVRTFGADTEENPTPAERSNHK